MFSKEEEKKMRLEFWQRFDAYCKTMGRKKKWILQDTGIKPVNLKFDIDRRQALVGVDIISHDQERRLYYYEKFESLKTILQSALGDDLCWELEYMLAEGKKIARIASLLPEVNLYAPETWECVHSFFFEKMSALEIVFLEYRDFIRYKPAYGSN
ncbi:MAG TPA: DUF4268 domain-containing protein [Bacteroidales bacterium]|nr:DUF4268 domain-containing protein [Bacteroidales bacterium]